MMVYIVMHNMGMDGSYIEAVFSKQSDADKLCHMYNSTDDFGNYDYYSCQKVEIDQYNIEDYYIDESDDWKTLMNRKDSYENN